MVWQPILSQKLGANGTWHMKGSGNDRHRPNLNVTDDSVEPRPDVAVHAFVIPDVPPTDSHPWLALFIAVLLLSFR
jgi:hypothetical protein